MFSKLLIFICVTIVSARNVYYEQLNPISSQIRRVPSYNNERIENLNEPETARNIQLRPINYDPKTVVDTAPVYDNRRENEFPERLFTNVRNDQQNKNIKCIERLNHEEKPELIIIHEKVNYEKTPPFTNKRRPEMDDTINSTAMQTRKNMRPTTYPTVTHGSKELPHTLDGRPRARTKDNQSNLYENSSLDINTLETTTLGIELEDRVAFEGDKCATGFVKVYGKCVKEQ
ncbi:unnamed protein product [Parnassius apollo]|uniref:(apollo) hypothetical protein n=1 Tax=Parnassius apollo TaxID=110799 RepID=A0A8S3XAD7_PARAO|nr:unnamed protein product [Parnassius apollo]